MPVQHIVALAFLGERPERMDVRHIDGDKLNNKVDNLNYGTRSENNYDITEHGKRKIPKHVVELVKESKEQGKVLAKRLGISEGWISQVRIGNLRSRG